MKKSKAIFEKPDRIHRISSEFKLYLHDTNAKTLNTAFHEEFEIKYFYEGSSLVVIDSDMIVAEQGDITVINPYEYHTIITNDTYSGKYLLMIIDLNFFAENGIYSMDLRELLLVKKLKFNHIIKNNSRLQQIILSIKEELDEKKECYRLIVSNLLCEFFALLLRDQIWVIEPELKGVDSRFQYDIIAPALEKIFNDYRNSISVDELAKICNTSKYHFCRVFKQQMGMTVTQYITNYRISLAASLLRDRKQSISDVALTCGFRDLSYFYRCYKRIKGTTPGKGKKK